MAIFSRSSRKGRKTAPPTGGTSNQHVSEPVPADSDTLGVSGASGTQSEAVVQANRQRLDNLASNNNSLGSAGVPVQSKTTSASSPSSNSRSPQTLSSRPQGHFRIPSFETLYNKVSPGSNSANIESNRAVQTGKSKSESQFPGQPQSDSGYSSAGLASEDFSRPRKDLTDLPTIGSQSSPQSDKDEGRANASPVTVLEAQGAAEAPNADRPSLPGSAALRHSPIVDAEQNSSQISSSSMFLQPRKAPPSPRMNRQAETQISSPDRSAPSSPQLRSGSNKKLFTKAAKVLGEEIPPSAYNAVPERPANGQPRVSFTQSPKAQSKLPASDDGFELALPEAATHTSSTARAPILRNASRSTELLSSRPSTGVADNSQVAAAYKVTLPPLSVLQGCTVNKFFKVQNDDGREIGELVEGDILDCVRRIVNAFGEVLDDDGSVVGRVRTFPVYHQSPPVQQEHNMALPASNSVANNNPQGTTEQAVPAVPDERIDAVQAPASNLQPSEAPTTSTSEPKTAHVEDLPPKNLPDIVEQTPSPPLPTEQEQNANPFAYKGAIPVTDGPIQRTPSFGTLARAPQAIAPHLLQVNTRPPRARQPLPRANSNPKMVFASQQTNNQPIRPSPLSSSEDSPPESEETSLQTEDKSSSSSYTQQPLVTPATSVYRPPPTEARPRTYFTHSGKVTVLSGGHARSESMPSMPSPAAAAAATTAATTSGQAKSGELRKVTSKRSRFSLGFGKKG